MMEKVNPSHPDKVADRVAGAIVDLAYKKERDPKVAVEVLLGHGNCHVIIESNVTFSDEEIDAITKRIVGDAKLDLLVVKQDEHLANNQKKSIKAGDNGIFKGAVLSSEEKEISKIAREIYNSYPYDGKYILDKDKLVICQSNASSKELFDKYKSVREKVIVNPLGEWTGGYNVDTGATNRKLGSDMGLSVTGGGLHGKDLSKADVSVNIYAFLKAQKEGKEVHISCAIGDNKIDGKDYEEIVEIARNYINKIGGFEEFAKWGLY